MYTDCAGSEDDLYCVVLFSLSAHEFTEIFSFMCFRQVYASHYWFIWAILKQTSTCKLYDSLYGHHTLAPLLLALLSNSVIPHLIIHMASTLLPVDVWSSVLLYVCPNGCWWASWTCNICKPTQDYICILVFTLVWHTQWLETWPWIRGN